MESEEIIRAYQLQPGDIFKRFQTVFRVRRIEKGKIYYYRHNPKYNAGHILEEMGAFNHEKLILITNKTKQNEHQN